MIVGWQWAVTSPVASAFSDLYRFNDPAVRGGGGGRWFTGSVADAYSCSVCHVEASSVDVLVQGLPAGYEPGASYDVYIRWPDAAPHVTALIEITDGQGRGAGSVTIPSLPPSAAEACSPAETGVPATIPFSGAEFNLANDRQLVGLQDCGGSLMHWQWTAPPVDVGPLLFAGGLVAPDQHMNAEGDRVARFERPIASPSQHEFVTQIRGSCSLRDPSRTRSRSFAPSAMLLLVAAQLARRRSPAGG